MKINFQTMKIDFQALKITFRGVAPEFFPSHRKFSFMIIRNRAASVLLPVTQGTWGDALGYGHAALSVLIQD